MAAPDLDPEPIPSRRHPPGAAGASRGNPPDRGLKQIGNASRLQLDPNPDEAMYALADLTDPPHPELDADPIEREIREIEDLQGRSLANRDLLYCSPSARHLVEREIPRLIHIIRSLRAGQSGAMRAGSPEQLASEVLAELRREVGVLRDLVERR